MNWVTIFKGKQGLVNTVFNIQKLYNLWNFLIKWAASGFISLMISGIEKGPGRSRDAVGPRGEGDPRRYRILKSVVGYFELDSVLLTEGSILDPYSRSRNYFVNNCRRLPSFRVGQAPRRVIFTTAQDPNVLLITLFSAAFSLRFWLRATECLSYTRHSNSPVQILSFSLRDHYCFQHNRSIRACYCIVRTHVQENPLFSFTDGFSPCEPATGCRLTRAKSVRLGCWVDGTVLSDNTYTLGGENRVVIYG